MAEAVDEDCPVPENGPDAMAEADDVTNDEEYLELVGFLQDPKFEVQRAAAEGVLAQTENQEFIGFCKRYPRKVARPLLRLVERAEDRAAGGGASEEDKKEKVSAKDRVLADEAGADALKAMVNVSTIPLVRDEFVSLNAPKRAANALRGGWLEGRAGLAHWHVMVLANLTSCQKGQEALCGEDGEPLLRFLLAAYVAKPRPPPRDGFEDPLICLGKVIGNVCALEAGRRLFASGEQGPATLAAIAQEMTDRNRRADVLQALSNACLDEECHGAVVQINMIARMSRFLYPWDKVDADKRTGLGADLLEALASEGATLTGDAGVRRAAATCILGLCRSAAGRDHLREAGAVEVVRAWTQEESDREVREMLEAIMPEINISEEELEARVAEAKAASNAPLPEGDESKKAVFSVGCAEGEAAAQKVRINS